MKPINRQVSAVEFRAGRSLAKAFAILRRNRRFFSTPARTHLEAFLAEVKPFNRARRQVSQADEEKGRVDQ